MSTAGSSNSKLQLRIKGYTIPSKKNHHFRGKNGKIMIDLEIKERIKKISQDIESQLRSFILTNASETWTEEQLRYWIASQLPQDDCWTVIPELHCFAQLVESTEDVGCEITIERINPTKANQAQ